jgi:predicted amidohydrolase
MGTIRIKGVQMAVRPSKKDNLPHILKHIERSDADVILFPKMSLTGYNNDFSDSRTAEAWKEIAAACRTSYTCAIIGTGARTNGHTYIQSRVFGHEGELLGTHDKIIPTEDERSWCFPGEGLNTFALNGLTFGCLICNDLWVAPGKGPYPDPRLSYQLSRKGARIIFHSAYSGTDPEYRAYHEANLELRAREAGAFIVTVNAAYESGECNSPSGVVSPDGTWVEKLPASGEQSFTVDVEYD